MTELDELRQARAAIKWILDLLILDGRGSTEIAHAAAQAAEDLHQVAAHHERTSRQNAQLLDAVRKWQEAFESAYLQCCKNPLMNTWIHTMDASKLNEAHQATRIAIDAQRGKKS